MPDQQGFNLPWDGRVECAEDGCGFSVPEWTDERVLAAHHEKHERDRDKGARQEQQRVQREATSRLRQVNRLRPEARQR